MTFADIPAAARARADWFHLTGYTFQSLAPRAVALALMAYATKPVSIDPGSAAPLRAIGAENFLRWTAKAALLLPNADEAAARELAEEG